MEWKELDGDWVTPKDYAEKYGVPQRTVYDMMRDGRLTAHNASWPRLVLDDGRVPIKSGQHHRWTFPD